MAFSTGRVAVALAATLCPRSVVLPEHHFAFRSTILAVSLDRHDVTARRLHPGLVAAKDGCLSLNGLDPVATCSSPLRARSLRGSALAAGGVPSLTSGPLRLVPRPWAPFSESRLAHHPCGCRHLSSLSCCCSLCGDSVRRRSACHGARIAYRATAGAACHTDPAKLACRHARQPRPCFDAGGSSRAYVCDNCTENGYTPKNPETYTCTACKKVTGGHGLFQSKNFQRAAKSGTQKCKGCFQ